MVAVWYLKLLVPTSSSSMVMMSYHRGVYFLTLSRQMDCWQFVLCSYFDWKYIAPSGEVVSLQHLDAAATFLVKWLRWLSLQTHNS